MADYNTFIAVDCNTRKPILTTSSARKAKKALCKGVRVEVWNNNALVMRIYDADTRKDTDPFAPYIQSEREYIGRKQAMAEQRNRRRKAARLARQQ